MKEALAKVRRALSKHDIVPALTQYRIQDGFIYATDGRYTAAAPVECTINFAVPGREFERLVDRLPSIDKIDLDSASITLRSRRSHGSIRLIDHDAVEYFQPEDEWRQIPETLLDALATIRPFISDNAIHPFALAACIDQDSLMATTNVSLIQVDCLGAGGAGHLLPCWAIDHVLSRRDADLDGVQFESNYAAFRWNDGSWIRTQLVNDKFPETGIELLQQYVTPTWAITDEWRAAYEWISPQSENLIEIYSNKLVGRQGAGEAQHEIPVTPVPDGENGYSIWNPKFLDAVIKTATHWSPDKWPNATTFAGPGLRGFIIGRR